MDTLVSLDDEDVSRLTTEIDDTLLLDILSRPTAPAQRFVIIEIETYKPGASTISVDEGYATHPNATLAQLSDAIESTGAILASDLGYVSLSTDPGGPVPYQPLLAQALKIDNKVYLEGPQAAVSAAWGALVLANPDRRYDGIAASWNSDGRPVAIRTGVKAWDRERQYYVDPPYASLTLMFAGLAKPWFLSDTSLTIPLRDATYWLERFYQNSFYGGTGGYDGVAALTGKPIPRTRGGTNSYPVQNVTPVLIDPTNRIYQYSDGAGTVVNLFEGGAEVITFQADVADLYSGSTTVGMYRTDNSRSLFQLGSVPVHAITANVTGEFPVAGAITIAAAIARYMLTEDMLLPADSIDLTSFSDADAAYPYIAGMYFDSSASPTGLDVMSVILGSFGAKLIPRRDGTLAAFVLRALAPGAVPVMTLDASVLAGLVPRALPATLDPPPFRSRLQYARNWTVQTSDINIATATADQQAFMAGSGKIAAWFSGAILTAFKRPNDRGPIAGALLIEADAQAAVDADGALFGVRRRLYDAPVPIETALALDIGDVVRLRYAMDDLASGGLGQVVGYQFDSSDPQTVLQVLV